MGTLILITGDDPSSIQTSAKKHMHTLVGDEPDEWSTEVVKEDAERGPEEVLKSLLESLYTPSFLGGDKTIHLQNFSAFGDEPAKSTKSPSPTGILLRKLAEFIVSNFPDDVNLIMSGGGIDKRKALFKACSEHGKVEVYAKPDLKSYKWRESVIGILRDRAGELGMTLDRASLEYLTEVIGTDTGRIPMELEKVFCYAGETPTLAQVRDVCAGNREAYFFAFTQALGERKLNACMEALTQTMANAKNEDGECIRLIRMSANQFRKLLHARIAMYVTNSRDGRALKRAVKNLSAADRDRLAGNSVLSMGDWQVGNLGDQATNYSGAELREAIQRFANVDRSNVSSSLPRRLVLETLIVQVIAAGARTRRKSA